MRRLRGWFATPLDAALTTLALAGAAAIALPLLRWAVVDATWRGDAARCHAGDGACWAFVAHKLRFLLFGLYPPSEQWRAAAATGVLLTIVVVMAVPRFWSRALVVAWPLALGVVLWLMRGGLGLAKVPTRQWGGLPVTLVLTTVGLTLGLPLGVLLALGRRSRAPVPRLFASVVVTVVRGVPLVAVLYLAALVVPLTLPEEMALDKLALAAGAVTLFAAAYLGEAVRSGLQVVSRGQMDASLSLGLRPWQAMRLVVLPQALRVVLPSLVAIAVGFYQDTSLVVVIGLFDLLNTARLAAQDPTWLGFHDEAYAFAAAVYFLGSFATTRYGLWLERRLGS